MKKHFCKNRTNFKKKNLLKKKLIKLYHCVVCIAVYNFLNFYGSISTRHKDLMNGTIAVEMIPTHVPYRWTRIAILIFLLMKSTFVFIYLLSSCRENCRLKNYFKDRNIPGFNWKKDSVLFFICVIERTPLSLLIWLWLYRKCGPYNSISISDQIYELSYKNTNNNKTITAISARIYFYKAKINWNQMSKDFYLR